MVLRALRLPRPAQGYGRRARTTGSVDQYIAASSTRFCTLVIALLQRPDARHGLIPGVAGRLPTSHPLSWSRRVVHAGNGRANGSTADRGVTRDGQGQITSAKTKTNAAVYDGMARSSPRTTGSPQALTTITCHTALFYRCSHPPTTRCNVAMRAQCSDRFLEGWALLSGFSSCEAQREYTSDPYRFSGSDRRTTTRPQNSHRRSAHEYFNALESS